MRPVLVALALALAAAPAAQTVPADGLVLWLRLDAADGRAAPGAFPLDVDRHARAGGAWPFGSDVVTLPHADVLDFDLRQDSYTLALWVRGTPGGLARVVQKWDERRATPYAFSLQAGPDGLAAVVSDPPHVHAVAVPGLWDGAWRHVAVRYDAGAGRLAAFRGGVRVGEVDARVRRSTRNGAPLTVGGAPGVDRDFSGALDDVRLWRRALADDEIAALARQ